MSIFLTKINSCNKSSSSCVCIRCMCVDFSSSSSSSKEVWNGDRNFVLIVFVYVAIMEDLKLGTSQKRSLFNSQF